MPERKQRLPRDDLVEIITEFYRCLVRMYIPESSLKFPPPGGWPSITEESTAAMKKKPFVIDLIKHLPYIDDTLSREMITHINYKCDVVDYTNPTELKPCGGAFDCLYGEITLWQDIEDAKKERLEASSQNGENPADDEGDDEDDSDDDYDGDDDGHYWGWDEIDVRKELDLSSCIPLASGYESGGRDFVLDVFHGTIHDETIRCQSNGQHEVQSFLEELQDRLERLYDVPLPDTKFEDVYNEGDFFEQVPDVDSFDTSLTSDYDNHALQVKSIYKSYGWPGEDYDKAGALKAISDLHYRRAVAEKEQEERQKSKR